MTSVLIRVMNRLVPEPLKKARGVEELPVPAPWSPRRLNALAGGMPVCDSYLEIGIEYGFTLRQVRAASKVGVDPQPRLRRREIPSGVRIRATTSNAFFKTLAPDIKFDLIFLDGLHEWFQTYTDLVNAFAHAYPWTIVVIDDVVPCDEYSAIPDQHLAVQSRHAAGGVGTEWHGDVYKVLLALAEHHPELRFRVITGESGNPQAVVWSEELTGPSVELRANPDDYRDASFDTVFANALIPLQWCPGSEEEVLREALTAVRNRHC